MSRGYVMLTMPEHPNANKNGRILEHRFVMSQQLGRPLTPDETVHHRNGVKADNRLENLELLSKAEHTSLHTTGSAHPRWKGGQVVLACAFCGTMFAVRQATAQKKNPRFCSPSCGMLGSEERRGEKHYNAKLTTENVYAIRALRHTKTQQELAIQFNISIGTIKNILQGKGWKHLLP